MSDSLRPHGLQPTRLLCPWDFPANSSGVDCHFLLQEIVLRETKINKDVLCLHNRALFWVLTVLSRTNLPMVCNRGKKKKKKKQLPMGPFLVDLFHLSFLQITLHPVWPRTTLRVAFYQCHQIAKGHMLPIRNKLLLCRTQGPEDNMCVHFFFKYKMNIKL